MTDRMMRIGHGFDVHRFAEISDVQTNMITLGGIGIPSERPLLAHSDGDVLLHAVCDALLGAIAAGDIGRHFPDTDERYKDADSSELLRHVYRLVRQKGYELGNLDVTVIAQTPRLSPYIDTMCESIATTLEVATECINVKATTTETLGYIGRREGIAVHSVVIVYKTS